MARCTASPSTGRDGRASRFSDLLAVLLPHRVAAHGSTLAAASFVGVDAVLEPLEEDRVRGPGWFDSSWDLRCGLEVREGLPADARLNEWLEVCLMA